MIINNMSKMEKHWHWGLNRRKGFLGENDGGHVEEVAIKLSLGKELIFSE